MFKELFENKTTAIFDLNSITTNLNESLIEAIDRVLKGIDIKWIRVADVFVHGAPVTETWEVILNDPLIKVKIPLATLATNTYSKFIEIIQERPIEVKKGFWTFVEELKVNKKYNLILKSIYSETITSYILESADLEDIFHIIEAPKGEENPNVYTKILKENKVKKDTVLVFEETILGAKKALRENLIVTIIENGATSKELFPKEVALFVPDFSKFVGNLDSTYVESLETATSFNKNPN
jgi:beta-phosphoglucomutase-like phosphatase (HAD superfamily)